MASAALLNADSCLLLVEKKLPTKAKAAVITPIYPSILLIEPITVLTIPPKAAKPALATSMLFWNLFNCNPDFSISEFIRAYAPLTPIKLPLYAALVTIFCCIDLRSAF